MRITVDIYQITKKVFVAFQPKNSCRLEFADNLWLQFLHQPQSYIVVFAIITFHVYNILVTKWKNGIGPIDIITLNE